MPRIVSIHSKDNPLLQRVRRVLKAPGAYRKEGWVWLEGDHLCSAALNRGVALEQALISESGWSHSRLQALAQQAASVAVLPDSLMASISSLDTPVHLACALPWAGGGSLQSHAPSVVLDRLQDAGNVGTILRSAAAFGFTQVLALKGCAALWSPKVLRAGMGAHFALNLVEVESLDELQALRVPLLATSSHAQAHIAQTPLPWPCAWVMGHEGQGVSPALEDRASLRIRIAQPGGEESLNVAAAAAICLHASGAGR